MPQSDVPASESRVIFAVAKAFRIDPEDISLPILQAKSFVAGRLSVLSQIGSSLSAGDIESRPGMLNILKTIGGLVAVVEGLSIYAGAAQVGAAVATVCGVTVAASTGILIGVGVAVLGAYLLYKGLEALWPTIRKRLEEELGDGWRHFWDA